MNRRKIRNLSFVKQGALNGFILGLLAQLIIFTSILYKYIADYLEKVSKADDYSGTCLLVGEVIVDYTSIIILPIILALTVAGSCFVVQKCFARLRRSLIVLWQFVGYVSFVIFNFYAGIHSFFMNIWWQCYSEYWSESACQDVSLISQFQLNWSDLPSIAAFLGIFLIYNLFFAFILRRLKSLLP